MYHITTETATQNGEFTDGDELNAIPPTDLNALWFNMIQRELLAILSGGNVIPNASVFNQVWSVIEHFGFKCVLAGSDATVNLSSFVGNVVVFHAESDFVFSGTIGQNCILIVIPYWQTNSQTKKIQFNYGGQTVELSKWQMYIGYALNGAGLSQTSGVKLPMFKPDGGFDVPYIVTDTLFVFNRVDAGVVRFAYSDEVGSSGLEEWREWQLKSLWGNNQVKKVLCTNDSEVSVPCFKKDDGSWNTVKFKPGVYKEFICVGSCVVEISGVNYEFAVLAVNGTAGA